MFSLLNSLSSRSPSLHQLETNLNPMHSQTDTTIRVHHPSSTLNQENRSLVKGNDKCFYPKYQIGNYVSRLVDGFSEYLGYGSKSYLLRV